MKRTVIYVLESGSISGGVRVIYEHLNRLRARGWHVEVYSLDAKRPAWFPLNPSIPWLKFDNYDHLTGHLAKRDAAKVATWWKTAFHVAEASGPGEGFYFIQDIETHYYTAPLMKQAVLSTYDLPLTQFTDSPYVCNKLKNCKYVGLGIDTNLYRLVDGVHRQINSVLALARAQRLKGWSTLCEVYRKLHYTNRFRLAAYGPAGLRLPYANMLTGLSDEDLVRFYNRTGIFISTSLHEGFGLPPLEAMACGAVVVCTDADGNMAYCRDKENCLIVPSNDAQAVVDACLDLLESPDLMMALQRGGFETAKEWPWDPVIDELEHIYG